jgi:flagellar motor switch protein FliN/FliY
MRDDIALTIANAIVKGALDVFEAMLSMPFSYELREPVSADGDTIRGYVERCNVVMRASLPSGGAWALMLRADDGAQLVALITGEGKKELDDEQMPTLREVAEPCLCSGITGLLERGGLDKEQPNEVRAEQLRPEAAAELLAYFSGPVTAFGFNFSAADAFDDAPAVLLLSEPLARLVPEVSHDELDELARELAGNPELSESEMSDILSGFSPEESSASKPGKKKPANGTAAVPPNLDMILDIRLVATARLGRVEMPINEILALGPGSIIDVGHLVDEPVELLVNNKLIARGDVVVVDEKFGLRITEIVSPKERIESMH